MKAFLTAIFLLLPAAAQAQTLPGASDIDDSLLQPGAWEVTMTFQRGEQEMKAGTTKYELVATPDDRWLYVTSTTTQLGTATDTSIVRRGTLEPLSHRSHAVPRVLTLDYDGTRVTGRYQPRDSVGRDIARVTEVPTFDAAMLDVILGSLPLASGYTTRLPMYIEEREGLTWFDVEVVGQKTVGSAAGWDVRVRALTYTVNFVIAQDDRRFLGGRVEYPNGAAMVLTRN